MIKANNKKMLTDKPQILVVPDWEVFTGTQKTVVVFSRLLWKVCQNFC